MTSTHPLHLCQPDAKKSCGACCGLYNWKDHSRSALQRLLAMQTELLERCLPSGDIAAYRAARQQRLTSTPLCPDIYNCEFLGFINPGRTRVGCRAHPALNGGRDLRDLCLYGRDICQNHFCPGYGCFSIIEQKAVIAAIDDWYLYGLVITDIDLVKEFFKLVENSIADSLKEHAVLQPAALEVLRTFFMLKETWPFKARDNRLGKYYFTATEYAVARIAYRERWSVPPSPYDKIFMSLESEFSSADDLRAAERIISDMLSSFISACGVRSSD